MGNRPRAFSRTRPEPARPLALDGRALSGTTGVVLDPIVSLRQRIRVPPGGSVRLCFATGMAPDRETVEALARKYHDAERGGAHLRAGDDPRRERPAPSRHFRGRRACCSSAWRRACSEPTVALRARRRRPSRRTSSARPGLWPHAISGDLPILLVRVVGERRDAAGAPGAAGPGVLAPQGHERRCRDRQRASGQLSRRDAGPADGRPRGRAVEHVAASAGRRVPAPRRQPGPRRSASCSKPWRARSCAATTATCGRSSIVPTRSDPSRRLLEPTIVAGALRFRRRPVRCRPRRSATDSAASPMAGGPTRSRSTATAETPMPWTNVIANAALRDHRHRIRGRAHVGREQPREPTDALRERSDWRSDRRSALRARRRHRRVVVAHTRADGAHGGRPLRRSPYGRRDALLAHDQRHRSRAGRLRRHRRSGPVLAAHADQ